MHGKSDNSLGGGCLLATAAGYDPANLYEQVVAWEEGRADLTNRKSNSRRAASYDEVPSVRSNTPAFV